MKKLNLTKKQKSIFRRLIRSDESSQAMHYLNSIFRGQTIARRSSHPVRVALRSLGYGQHEADQTGVRCQPNYFLNQYNRQFELGQYTKPLNRDSKHYVGVEIECLVDLSTMGINPDDYGMTECYTCEGSGRLTYIHRDSGYEMEGECQHCEGSGEIESDEQNEDRIFEQVEDYVRDQVKELKIKGLNLKQDGSLRSDDNSMFPVEFTLIYDKNDDTMLKKTIELLRELKAEVNDSCGLHVHLDARHLKSDQVVSIGEKFNAAMPFLAAMVPQKRRQNTYCCLSVSKLDGDRYHAVNLTAFEKYKTIEIRLHSGTTDLEKISSWVKIISGVMNSTETISSWDTFYSAIKADSVLKEYIQKRVEKFSDSSQSEAA